MRFLRRLSKNVCGTAVMTLAVSYSTLWAEEKPKKNIADHQGLPLLLDETFAQGANRWQPADPNGWKMGSPGVK